MEGQASGSAEQAHEVAKRCRQKWGEMGGDSHPLCMVYAGAIF